MKRLKTILILMASVFAFASCNLDDLKQDIDNIKDRVSALESVVTVMNDNFNNIKNLLDGKKTISDIQQAADGTYTITVSDENGNKETITIAQGSEGKIVHPTVSVNDAGNWVINGVELAQAIGKDGKIPEFRINGDDQHWEMRYRGEGDDAWVAVKDKDGNIVLAVGDNSGSAGGDSLFASAEVVDGYFVFTLNGSDTQYKVPVMLDFVCEIAAPLSSYENGVWSVGHGKTATTKVNVKGGTVRVIAPYGWSYKLNEQAGELSVTAPAYSPVETKAVADNSNELVLQVFSNGYTKVAKIKVEAFVGSYWDVFSSGADVEIEGFVFNKTLYPDAMKIAADGEITKAGVYFVEDGGNVSVGKFTAGQLVIIGDNPRGKSALTFSQQIMLNSSDGTGLLFVHNLDATVTVDTQLFRNNEDSDFANVIIDGNSFTFAGLPILVYAYCTSKEVCGAYKTVSVTDNFFNYSNITSTNTAKIFATGVGSEKPSSYPDIEQLTIRNNVCAGAENDAKAFGFVSSSMHSILNIDIESNTIINLQPLKAQYVNTGGTCTDVRNFIFKHNFFYLYDDDLVGSNCRIMSFAANAVKEYDIDDIHYYYAEGKSNYDDKGTEKPVSFYWGQPSGMKVSAIKEASNPFEGKAFDYSNPSSFCIEGVSYGAHL